MSSATVFALLAILIFQLLAATLAKDACVAHLSRSSCVRAGSCGWCALSETCENGTSAGSAHTHSRCSSGQMTNGDISCWSYGTESLLDTGPLCKRGREIDDCDSLITCHGNGDCTEQPNSPCNCYPGYYPAASCATYCNDSLTCRGHGSCAPDGTCVCQKGFFGASCLPCDAKTTCADRGVCNVNATSADEICVCADGWYTASSCAEGFEMLCAALNCSTCLSNSSCGWCVEGDVADQCVNAKQKDCLQFTATCPLPNQCTAYDTCTDCTNDPNCAYCESANRCQLQNDTCASLLSNCAASCSVLNQTQCSNGSRCDCIGCGSQCWFTPDGRGVPGRACPPPVSYRCSSPRSPGADVPLIIGLTLLALLATVAVGMLCVVVFKLLTGRRATYTELK